MIDARDGVALVIKRVGHKQKAVAEQAGLTEFQLSAIMNKRRRLDANEMFRLCQALHVTPNELFGIVNNERATVGNDGTVRR